MAVDWSSFTPVPALVGGLLIGLSAGLFALLNGRIAGISGVLGGLLRPVRGDVAWRAAFLGGLVVAPLGYALVAPAPLPVLDVGTGTLVVAGLLVGFGTRLGSGCTSGHGVCGMSRLSLRSFVATAAFMAAGVATVYVTRHLLAH